MDDRSEQQGPQAAATPRQRKSRWPLWLGAAVAVAAIAFALSWALGLTKLGRIDPDQLSGSDLNSAAISDVADDEEIALADDVPVGAAGNSLAPPVTVGNDVALASDDPAAIARAEMARLDKRQDSWDREKPAPPFKPVRERAAPSDSASIPQGSPQAATPARPRGSLTTLFSSDDYPQSALSRGEQGTTAVQLGVSQTGRVETCRIIQSSGSTTLDTATCRILVSRARFTPAIDGQGYRTNDTVTQRIAWRLP